MEQKHSDPDLFLFHDIITDEEMETIKQISKDEVRILNNFAQARNNESEVTDHHVESATEVRAGRVCQTEHDG